MGKTTGSLEASTSSFGNKYGSPRETRPSATTRNGFSLVEIAIIMVILGLIVGTVIPRLIKVVQQEAIKETKTDIQDSRDELIGYVLATGCIMPANTAACESIIAHRKDKWNNNFYCEIPAALESADVVNFNATTGMSVQVGASAQEDEIAYLVGSKGRNGARDLGLTSPFQIQSYDESGYDDIVEYVSLSYLQSLCTSGGDEGEIDLEEEIDEWEGSIAVDPDNPGGVEIGDFDGDGEPEIRLYDDKSVGKGKGGAGCIWYPGSASNCDSDGLCTFGSGLRAYFTLRVSAPTKNKNLDGLTFAVLGSGEDLYGTFNATSICGDVGQANGYGANNQNTDVEPFVLAPKVAVEFDWSGGSGLLGDPEPNHIAILYWATYDEEETEFKKDANCKQFNPKWVAKESEDNTKDYDDVIHGYGASGTECDPLRADRIGTFLGGYSADDLRLPNPGVATSGYRSVPDIVVGKKKVFPWLEDFEEHPVRIEVHWNNATGELNTKAWVGCADCLNINDDVTTDLTGFTCNSAIDLYTCNMVEDTVTVPEGLRKYFYKVRWGWTMGDWTDGEVFLEGPKVKFIP